MLTFCRHGSGLIRRATFTFGRRFSSPRLRCFYSMEPTDDYDVAVTTLNSLQSNYAVLEKARLNKDKFAMLNVPQTEEYLRRVGVTPEDLKRLRVVHVSGTKGKGSTCSFCESILRQHGLKTGFYSSPHLVQVRERIRINGDPISRELFAKYFWQVYDLLIKQKENDNDMPAYFKFLTVMAFYVFLKENVDAAIIEVGIGGLYDCTNVLRKPTVVGITSLGLDHTSILGDTVEKIALHKAGIMKPSVITFTVADQPGNSMQVLQQQASQIQSPIYIVPPLDAYFHSPIRLGLHGQVQRKNASLALQLCRQILDESNKCPNEVFPLTGKYLEGLSTACWPGRSHIIKSGPLTYYIDGAHTLESIQACVDWFSRVCPAGSDSRVKKVLVFNTTGDRDSVCLMSPLHECGFELVILCPNVMVDTLQLKDQMNLMVTREQLIKRCETNKRAWLEGSSPGIMDSGEQEVVVVGTINEALETIKTLVTDCKVAILVTGSLHLVGGVLSLVDPQLNFLRGKVPAMNGN